ncbi:MAG: universal stress protein [Proteobacteria bacterium]|nr:universal stress protein [Pseudomonadota bacterium]MBU1594848.1 universal stress protein [Pseudomonadota bacterium]
MFKDILLAITPSELCDCAAEAAFHFAQRFESRLMIVHVCGMAQGWGEMEFLESSGEVARIKASVEEYYKEKLRGLDNYEVKVVPGVPHVEILRIARKMNADLVVMGPHTKEYAEQRSRMWGMTGSTLEQVSQKAACPVMIVAKSTPYGEHNFLNIVAATDFSDQADCAVHYGGQIARHYKAGLTVFHCVDLSGENGRMSLGHDEVKRAIAESKASLEERYGDKLRGIKNSAFEAWEGMPAMEILKLARMREANLILMAHHTRERDPEKAFLGSTVIQVALNSPCPTISVNRHFDLRCGLMYDQTGEAVETSHKAAAGAGG